MTLFLDFAEFHAGDWRDPDGCRAYLVQLYRTKSPTTARNYVSILKAWFDWLVQERHIDRNPWDLVADHMSGNVATHTGTGEGIKLWAVPPVSASAPEARLHQDPRKPWSLPPVREITKTDREMMEAWEKHLKAEGKRTRTLESYRASVRKYLSYLLKACVKYDGVTHRIITAWKVWLLDDCKMKPRAINTALSAVRSYYRWLRIERYVYSDPFVDVRCMKAPRLLPKPIPKEDVFALIRTASHVQDRAILLTFYSTGARVGEMEGMNLGGVDLDKGAIRVLGKGGKERMLYLKPVAVQAIKAYLDWRRAGGDSDWTPATPLWTGHKGGRLDKKSIRGRLKAVAAKAGVALDVYPHRLRHSFATHLLDAGADLRTIQELLGHSSIMATQIYTGVAQAKLKEVHAALHPLAEMGAKK